MKRASPPFQFLAAAATDSRTFAAHAVAATTMSSRPLISFWVTKSISFCLQYRGGRTPWRRNFSDRSGTGDRGQFVTGDSHFQSVRDTNLGIRQGGFSNQNGFRPQRLNPRAPPYNQNQQFRHPPPFNHNQHQQFRQPPPSDQNQQFRPPQQFRPRPPRPLDYRGWEYAKTLPPPDSERFVVLSYNILADYLAINHRSKLYFHVPHYILDWQWRKNRLIFELGLWSADIMCFQEVDRFQDLDEELKLRGYSGIWKMRTGDPIDGCAIFWRTSRFKLLHEESIEFNKLGLRDNVAQICVLELMSPNCNKSRDASPTRSTTSKKVVICNIHVLYNPKRGEIKLGQVRMLLDRAHAVSKIWDDAPVVLCGDFNCTPKSPLYNFISEQKLELSELDRDKVSGQASAEIRAPRADNPHGRIHSANSSIEAVSMVNKEDGDKLSDSISEKEKQNDPANSVGSLPCIDKLSSLQMSNPVSDESCTMQCGKDDQASFTEVTKETQNVIYRSVGGTGTHILAAVDGSRESSIAFRHKDGFAFDSVNDEIHEINTPAASGLEHCSQSLSFVDEKGSSPVPDEVNVSSVSANFDSEVDEKLEKLSLNELDEVTEEGKEILKDDSACLSALHNTEDGFPPDLGPIKGFAFSPDSSQLYAPDDEVQDGYSPGLDSEIVDVGTYNCNSPQLHAPGDEVLDGYSPGLDSKIVDVEKYNYDPSLWTPMELATASGNVDCTFLEHCLKLKSTYTEVEDCSGTRDQNGEPLVTSYNRRFFGTVDYIWRSEGLQTVMVLAPIPTHAMQWTPGFPTKKWGSDHVALASELAFTKDKTDQNMEVC
ncbi:carbon catabolite repressor protein 4 homolog 6 isoform X2 [Tripterygium wilfordii]|uniref:carbon catabolite repressor protein 4 homolog 6 isoform X2 n=1 Tax=Tripterygium wilfordii TaxID=458696 RepID=UPI0018F7E7ED|nr:carbon catabolite repressor protein 4 homolog 6 isoform X2 [Tripterygium wilfordii]